MERRISLLHVIRLLRLREAHHGVSLFHLCELRAEGKAYTYLRGQDNLAQFSVRVCCYAGLDAHGG